jgi:hypothetical protein
MAPSAGATFAGDLNQIVITFSESLSPSGITAAHVLLVGAVSGTQTPSSLSFNSGNQQLTAAYASPLPQDSYTLTLVSGEGPGGLSDLQSNALDGECPGGSGPECESPGELPSGTGSAGGNFVASFNVIVCRDLDGDGFGAPGNAACPAGPLTDCNDGNPLAHPGATEVCDGVDNDCDTQTDEGLGQTRCGLGVCDHTVDNCVDSAPQTCDPFEGSSTEACDGLDNDCEGAVDEDFAVGQACDGTDADLCQNGTFTCVADGLGVECVNETVQNVQEICDGTDNDCDGVTDEGSLTIHAVRHAIGLGSHPGSTKTPLPGILIRVYDRSADSCARTMCGGSALPHWSCIVSSCTPAAGDPDDPDSYTDSTGEVSYDLPPDDYLVLGLDPEPAPDGTLFGSQASQIICGDQDLEVINEIVDAKGNIRPGKKTVRTGSELLIIEPEVVEWSTTQELYPVVLESQGDWSVTTGIVPPEGFVSDYPYLSTQVSSSTQALQFTVTDIGSSWIPTGMWHRVVHGGRREVILNRISVRLSESLAQQKGLSTEGYVLDATGQPIPEPGFDPRAEKPVQISGWIERSTVDPNWVVKLRVNVSSDLKLSVVNSKDTVIKVLASGPLSSGEHSIVWDGFDRRGRRLALDKYYLKLEAGALVQKLGLLNVLPF